MCRWPETLDSSGNGVRSNVSSLMLVLGTELKSFGKTASTLNHWTISLALSNFFRKLFSQVPSSLKLSQNEHSTNSFFPQRCSLDMLKSLMKDVSFIYQATKKINNEVKAALAPSPKSIQQKHLESEVLWTYTCISLRKRPKQCSPLLLSLRLLKTENESKPPPVGAPQPSSWLVRAATKAQQK